MFSCAATAINKIFRWSQFSGISEKTMLKRCCTIIMYFEMRIYKKNEALQFIQKLPDFLVQSIREN